MSAKCYQKLFYSKRKKNLVTRLYIKRNKDFFESPLKTFPLEITILAVVELIEKLEEIKKNIRTWGCGTSRSGLGRFEGGSHISIFYRRNILSKTFIPYCSHDCAKSFLHSYALLRCIVLYKNVFL